MFRLRLDSVGAERQDFCNGGTAALHECPTRGESIKQRGTIAASAVLAGRIIAGRPYTNVNDLGRVSGIGLGLLERIRPYFTADKAIDKKT